MSSEVNAEYQDDEMQFISSEYILIRSEDIY